MLEGGFRRIQPVYLLQLVGHKPLTIIGPTTEVLARPMNASCHTSEEQDFQCKYLSLKAAACPLLVEGCKCSNLWWPLCFYSWYVCNSLHHHSFFNAFIYCGALWQRIAGHHSHHYTPCIAGPPTRFFFSALIIFVVKPLVSCSFGITGNYFAVFCTHGF